MMNSANNTGAGAGNLAGTYSQMADSIYNDGIQQSIQTEDYIDSRLKRRQIAAQNYSRTSYLTNGRGDPRNKIGAYRTGNNSTIMSNSTVRTLSSSRRGLSGGVRNVSTNRSN